jgi:thiamine-monophosphate kinase
MRESSFIDWIRSQSGFEASRVPVGPGDDMAVVTFGGERLLVTTDQVLDGVHFVLSEHGPAAAGRKAMARGLSDVAAMAAVPVAAVATVALPKGTPRTEAEAIYHGLRTLADAFDCPLVGGDVAGWDGPLAITVTAFARPGGTPPVLRSGARVGDAICVTGAFGGAWSTARHLTFTPRIAEALALADRGEVHAMIDVSDGLAVDLAHVCEASGVGAEILAASVPIHPDARQRPDPLAAALGDGEDYELLFSLAPEAAEGAVANPPPGAPVTRIGTIAAGSQRTLILPDGRREPLEARGWEHTT